MAGVTETGKGAGAGKYDPAVLIKMFRRAAKFRDEMCDQGFTDNAGAIHSAERIMDLLGLRLRYPGLSHRNNLRTYAHAEFSVGARTAMEAGEKVLIEHVSPHRHFTQESIRIVRGGASDTELVAFVMDKFRLVLLSPEETVRLNKANRSRMTDDRLGEAGIQMAAPLEARGSRD